MSDDLSDGLAEPADTRTAQEAAALSEASTWVGGEVSAVGLGRTDDGAPCVIVYASAAGDIPAEVSGLPVRVVVSDPVLALAEEDRPES